MDTLVTEAGFYMKYTGIYRKHTGNIHESICLCRWQFYISFSTVFFFIWLPDAV